MIRLKGILWKPGINGLGVRGFHHLPYRKRFDSAARMHDKLYDCNGTSKDRFNADRLFVETVCKVAVPISNASSPSSTS